MALFSFIGIAVTSAAYVIYSQLPADALEANTAYTAVISANASDLAGNSLASEESWSFTTSATEPRSQR